jgi:hypothetical protein
MEQSPISNNGTHPSASLKSREETKVITAAYKFTQHIGIRVKMKLDIESNSDNKKKSYV